MSEDTTEQAAEKKTAKEEAPKAARKAAKKVAKTATKKATKDASASAKSASPSKEDPMDKPAKPAKATKAKSEQAEKPSAEESKSKGGSQDESGDGQQRFGRVPGGGRVDQDNQHNQQASNKSDGNDGNDGGERGGEKRKKRRRKRRRGGRQGNNPQGQSGQGGQGGQSGQGRGDDDRDLRDRPAVLDGPKVEVDGLLELAPKGFGFLRVPDKKFEQARDDVFVSPELVRNFGLRPGHWVHGLAQEGPRGPQLVEIKTINDLDPEDARKAPAFEELKAVNPNKRIAFETTQDRYTTRVVDLVSPVGRGQRGLIVSPPRSGKTTLLLHIAEAVCELHDETLHPMVLLVDERPEEVTEFRRCLPGVEIYASSNDEHPRNHTRIAELCIERAKRLVEEGRHVFLLMDSITRLARAYNGATRGGRGRGIGSGGIMVGALEEPRRLFAAARNTREAGSLTILATALVQTNSRADDAIFQEFKGTGNMELVLDRKIAENYIYPAVDIFKSGTRREELLLAEHTLHKIHMIRRGLSGHRPVEAMERLLFFLKKFPNNPQMLLEIKG